jgi:hypothetical protein
VLTPAWEALSLAVAHIAAAFAVGFGVGASLQWMYVPKWKDEQLRNGAHRWWQRFRDLKWSNFSQAEAKAAVELMDRFIGVGWRRVRIAAALVLSLYCLSFGWFYLVSFIGISVLGWKPEVVLGTFFIRTIGGLIASLITTGFLFFMSLSVTRWIALTFARFGGSKVVSIAMFATLLAIHLFLLVRWSNLTFLFSYTILQLVSVLPFWIDVERSASFTSDWLTLALKAVISDSEQLRYSLSLPFSYVVERRYTLETLSIGVSAFEFTKALLDVLSNGLRIVFALVFLASYLFRPILQVPITNAWERAMDDKRPVLAMLLGSAAGGVVVVVEIVGLFAMSIQALRVAL